MATAAELLAGMSTGDDTTLVIDNYLRTINIPKRVTNLGVEHDDEVLFLNFKMPRYLDDTDLSKFSIRINYINANGDSDAYTVNEDKKVVGENFIKFSWLVGPTATAYKGTTKFNVCMKTMKTVDDQQVIDKEYNTTVASLPVLEGLEVDESIVTQYSDLIEQWREDIFGETNSEIQKIRDESQKAAQDFAEFVAIEYAKIPNDYTITSELAEEGVRTKADAIVNTADGTSISVSDCSNDHIRNLRVFGKTSQAKTTGTQLFNPYAEQNNSFATATVENNGSRITVTGTYYVSWPLVLKAGVTYYINFNTVGPATNRAIRFEYPDKEITGTVTNPASFTPTKDTVSVYLYAGLGTEDTIIYENIQISEGSSALPWEPYSGGVASPTPEWPQPLINVENPTVDVHGKNLAVQKYAIDTTTKGIRIFTQNNASEALLNGTAESLFSHTVLRTGLLPPGTYTVSATGVNLHDDGHDRLYVADYYTGKVYANYIRDGSHKTITITEPARFRIDMVFKEGTVYNNSLIKIQIESGDVATEYEPCKVTQSISSDHAFLGVPVELDGNYIDSNGQQWVCDEIDFERGMYIQRIGTEVFDGSIDEIWHDELVLDKTVMFRIQISDSVNVGNVVGKDYLCSNFVVKNMYNSDVQGTQHTMQQFYFRLNKTALSTADMEGFRLYLERSPMTVNYVLATPIETPLTTAELEAFKALYTNHPNTTVLNDSGAPMQLTYNVDTKIYVDNGIKQTVAEVMEAIANGSY
jgi:hypothetical protein